MAHLHVSLTSRLSMNGSHRKTFLQWGWRTKSLRNPGLYNNKNNNNSFISDLWSISQAQSNNTRAQKGLAKAHYRIGVCT